MNAQPSSGPGQNRTGLNRPDIPDELVIASRFWLNESLSQLMSRLEPLFVRIHRNAAVNRREVDRLHRQVRVGASDSFGLRVGVRGWPEELEVSRTHRHRVRSLFKSVEVTRPR